MDAKSIAYTLNDCLNQRDFSALSVMLMDNVTFTGSSNHSIMGKKACIEAWRTFCRLFPDYQSEFEEIVVNGETVSVRGYSTCSNKRMQGPALWSGTIKDGKVYEWRVHHDTTENRVTLGLI
ncbi:MAG: nuclear transport factor 2 family protein [Cyclobacteriaceae bacterium]